MKFQISFGRHTQKEPLEVEIDDSTKKRNQCRAAIIVAIAKDANLSDANLSDANLINANLYGANLSDANLSDANLSDANLINADLYGADLSGANLSDANLSDANLYGANLRNANLRNANLRNANLRNANLIDAGQDARGYRFVGVRQKDGVMISAGCRWLSLADAKVHWANRHDEKLRAECLEKVALIETAAKARGWL